MEPIHLAKIPLSGLEIHERINFDSSYYQHTDIIELKNVKVDGTIKKNQSQDIFLNLVVVGNMIIPDARTLEPIVNSFSFEIEEKLDESNEEIQEYFEKEKNILDIMGILWENIVLEVPIRKTISNTEIMSGNGWELKEEKKESIDPRLAPLRKLLDKEEE